MTPRRRPAAKQKGDADERRKAAAELRELERQLHAAERAAKKARAEADALADEVAAAEQRLRKLRG